MHPTFCAACGHDTSSTHCARCDQPTRAQLPAWKEDLFLALRWIGLVVATALLIPASLYVSSGVWELVREDARPDIGLRWLAMATPLLVFGASLIAVSLRPQLLARRPAKAPVAPAPQPVLRTVATVRRTSSMLVLPRTVSVSGPIE